MSVITTVAIKANNNFKYTQIPGLDHETGKLHLKSFMESELVQGILPGFVEGTGVDLNDPASIVDYMIGFRGLDYTKEDIVIPSHFNEKGEWVLWGNYAPYITVILDTLAALFPGTTFYGFVMMEGDWRYIKVVQQDGELKGVSARYYDCQDQSPSEKTEEESILEKEFDEVWGKLNNMDLEQKVEENYLYFSITERETSLIEVGSSFETLYDRAKVSFLEDIEEHFGRDSEEFTEAQEMFAEVLSRKESGEFSSEEVSTDGERGIVVHFESGFLNFWSNDKGNFDIYVEKLPRKSK